MELRSRYFRRRHLKSLDRSQRLPKIQDLDLSGAFLGDDLNTSSSIDADVRSNVSMMPGVDADSHACIDARIRAKGSSTADAGRGYA